MKNTLLLMISPVIFLPLFVIAIAMGMNDLIVTGGMVTYITILFNNLSK